MSQTPRGARAQRGAIMIQFVMVSFGLMAILAVALDVGMMRAVQASMSNGTDTAALEGLRLRNALPAEYTNADRDMFRRLGAQRMMALVYDEDMDLATRNSEYRFGMGGHIATGVGESDGGGGGTVNLAPTGLLEDEEAYAPTVIDGTLTELNAERNYRHGDMVAGDFTRHKPSLVGEEDSSYGRMDFDSDMLGVEASAKAFLVRARRGGRSETLDHVGTISSAGPAVPAIFALGALVGADENSDYNVRRDGYTVRSTSIADTRPALAVGLAGPGGAYKGAPDLGLTLSGDHMTLAVDAFMGSCGQFDVDSSSGNLLLTLHANGELNGPTSLLGACSNLANFARIVAIADAGTTIGFGGGLSPLPASEPLDLPALALNLPRDLYYLPNYRSLSLQAAAEDVGFDNGCNAANPTALTPDCFQVVGFSAVQVLSVVLATQPDGEQVLKITLANLGLYVAQENASALDRAALASYAGAEDSVKAAHEAMIATGRHLLVPVLVR